MAEKQTKKKSIWQWIITADVSNKQCNEMKFFMKSEVRKMYVVLLKLPKWNCIKILDIRKLK